MLELEGVSKTYRKGAATIRALDGASLRVPAGEFLAVQGPSGCGKTTLLLTAGALLAPQAGKVRIGPAEPYAMSPEARSALRAEWIGFVFQQFHLLPYLTVRQNVLAPSLAGAGRAPAPRHAARPGDRADELLERFNLSARAGHHPAELSTGERQRVAMARAMLNRPRILLADEPTGNLDAAHAEEVLRALAEFADEGGAVLLVTHDARAAGHAGRIVPMRDGRLG